MKTTIKYFKDKLLCRLLLKVEPKSPQKKKLEKDGLESEEDGLLTFIECVTRIGLQSIASR